MIEVPSTLQWKKHDPNMEVFDGDTFLVAIEVKNNKTKKKEWEVYKIRVSCDWDGASGFFDMVYADCAESTLLDAWSWEDFEWSIKLEE